MADALSPIGMLKEFHDAVEAGGRNVRYITAPDAYGREKVIELRMKLIREEYREVMDELLDHQNGQGDILKIAKELADLAYVVYGCAEALEIPLVEVLQEVHRSNMTKTTDGAMTFRGDGKVLKPDSYEPADVAEVFLNAA